MDQKTGVSTTSSTLCAGKIGAPHGIKGWVKVFSYTDPIENLLDYRPWFIEYQGKIKEISVITHQIHKANLLVQLEGVNDRNQAELLTNKFIYVKRDQLPSLEENEYYWIDLEGLTVKNLEGFCFGQVNYLMFTGANDVMFIKNGKKEYCLPYLMDKVVKKVDFAEKEILVDWPENLE